MTPPDIQKGLVEQGELRNALAFKGRSRPVYEDAVRQVRAFGNNPIFPPRVFPDTRHPDPETSILPRSSSIFDGPFSPAEAVSVVVLLNESAALCNAFGRSWEVSALVKKVLQLPENAWQHDAIEAVCEFGSFLGMAAGVRQRASSTESKPKGKTLGDVVKQDWNKRFEKAIRDDNFVLGKNTASAVVKVIDDLAEKNVRGVPEAAKTEEEIQARIASRKYGARLAEKLYLEALDKASHELSTQVGLKEVEIPGPKQISA